MGAISEPANIHAGAHPDMLQRRQRFDLTFIVVVFLSRHKWDRLNAKRSELHSRAAVSRTGR